MISDSYRRLVVPQYSYKIVFMRRNIQEVLASQRQMLIRRGEPTDTVSDDELARLFQKHLQFIDAWVQRQGNVEILYVSYNDILEDPYPLLEQINRFLGGKLRIDKMAAVIDPALYRQRKK